MKKTALLLAALAALTLAAYWPVTDHDFVAYDDDIYVTANRHVTGGLTAENVRWAFTSFGYAANWHPLTWLSHQADVSLFGPRPGPHHLVSLLLHTAGALVLFLALRGATGAAWPSAFAAALFALHPLHVESVAWVAERKDVLSGLCWALSLLAYLAYVRRPGARRYLLVAACFALGLLAKPMVVTLPAVLLLLDFWPLGRWGLPGRSTPRGAALLLLEKLPLALLAAASSVVTYLAQQSGGGLVMSGHYPLAARLSNAAVSLVSYPAKLLLPVDLAVLYPFREQVPLLQAGAAALLALGITLLALRQARRRPWLAVGWLWYLVAVLPVIGVLQVGFQSMADRYSYLPSIGLFVLAAAELRAAARRRHRAAALALAAAAVLLCAVAARHQVGFWRDSETLFRRATAVTRSNWLAENNLGTALLQKGRLDEAIEHFTAALRVNPGYARTRVNLGDALLTRGKGAEALAQYEAALALDPSFSLARYHRGRALIELRRFDEALVDLRATLAQHPESADAHATTGVALLELGRPDEALGFFQAALRLDPGAVLPRLNMGLVLFNRGETAAVARLFREVIRLDPARPEAHLMLGRIAEREGRAPEAAASYREALRLRPGFAEARRRLERLEAAPGR
jgi:tetratricopeptide (TPR) repeat protein